LYLLFVEHRHIPGMHQQNNLPVHQNRLGVIGFSGMSMIEVEISMVMAPLNLAASRGATTGRPGAGAATDAPYVRIIFISH
jgi:hypothetical protein